MLSSSLASKASMGPLWASFGPLLALWGLNWDGVLGLEVHFGPPRDVEEREGRGPDVMYMLADASYPRDMVGLAGLVGLLPVFLTSFISSPCLDFSISFVSCITL